VTLSTDRYAGRLSPLLQILGRRWSVLASGPTCPAVEIDPESRASVRKRWAGGGDALGIVYGKASRAKRYDLALEALRILREEGHPVRLLMLGDQEGGDAGYCREVRETAERAGTGGALIWSGPLPAGGIAEILAAGDFLWHLNGGGITTRSGAAACAFAQGLPVIAFRGRSLDSAFVNGENVLVVKQLSARNLADATKRLLASREVAETLRRGARSLHAEVFGWPVIAEQCLELLRSVEVEVE
jgi:glycosyltransferase involved in cell wall biosynthesis